MAKKVRRKLKTDQQHKRKKKDLSSLFHEWRNDILSAPSQKAFLAELRNLQPETDVKLLKNLAAIQTTHIPLPSSVSTIGGMTETGDGRILISDEFHHRLLLLDADLSLLNKNKEQDNNRFSGSSLRYPRQLFRCRNGRILLIDAWNHRICTVQSSKQEVTPAFGKYGDAEGEFFEPSSIAEDKEGRLYISDRCNHRIQVFKDNAFLFSFGERGECNSENPRFEFPTSLLMIQEKLFILDSGNNIIQVCSPAGKPLYTIAPSDGAFFAPQSMIQAGEFLIVADMNNALLRFFTLSGLHLFNINPAKTEQAHYPYQLFFYNTSLFVTCSDKPEELIQVPLPPFSLKEYSRNIKSLQLNTQEGNLLNILTDNNEKNDLTQQKILLKQIPSQQEGAFFYALLDKPQHGTLLNELLCKKIISSFESIEKGIRERTHRINNYLTQNQKLEEQLLSAPEKTVEISSTLEIRQKEFAKETDNYFDCTDPLLLLFSLFEKLDDRQKCYQEETSSPFLSSRLELTLKGTSLLLSIFDLKEKYNTQAGEEFHKNRLHESSFWYAFHNAHFFSHSFLQLFARVYLLLPLLLQSFTRSLPRRWDNQHREQLRLLTEHLATLHLYEDFTFMKEETGAVHCENIIRTTLQHLRCHTNGKLHGSLLKDNPDIAALSSYLRGEIQEMPLSITPLTQSQLLTLESSDISKGDIDALKLDATEEQISKVTQELIDFTLQAENRLTPLLQEREKFLRIISEAKTKKKWFIKGDMKQHIAVGKEILIARFSLEQVENETALTAAHHRIAINLLFLCNYALLTRHPQEENSKSVHAVFQDMQTIYENFNQQCLKLYKEHKEIYQLMGEEQELLENDFRNRDETEVQRYVKKEEERENRAGTAKSLSFLMKHFMRLHALSQSYLHLFRALFPRYRQENLPQTLREGEGRLVGISHLPFQSAEDFIPLKCLYKDGEYFINNYSKRRIERFNSDGSLLGIYFCFPSSPPLSLTAPATFAFDKAGNHAVIDMMENRIFFLRDGVLIKSLKKDPEHQPVDIFPLPGDEGGFILTHRGKGHLLTFSGDGDENTPVIPQQANSFPNGSFLITFDHDLGWLVTEEKPVRIRRYDENWKLVAEYQAEKEGMDLRCIAVDSYQRIWCSDMLSSCLHIFDKDLNYLGRYGSKGYGPGEFILPAYITSHPEGLIVTDCCSEHISLLRLA